MEKAIIATSCVFTVLILGAIFVLHNIIPVAAKNPALNSVAQQVNKAGDKKIEGSKPLPEVKVATTTKANVKVKPAVKETVVTKPVVKTAVAAKPVVKTAAVSTKTKYGTTLKWDASALKLISNFQSFDYNTAIRSAYIKKVESYARRNNISTVTYAVINSMRE